MSSLARVLPILLATVATAADFTFERTQGFLSTYCKNCHGTKPGTGGFLLDRVSAEASLETEPRKWTSLANRVRNGDMPPKGSPAPTIDEREGITRWVEETLRAKACASGPVPGPAVSRRLNRDEYAATIRDLLDIHLDLGSRLPADGAGGEGFDNAAETLFLSPLHAEKYMETAKFIADFAAKEFKSHAKIFTAKPGPGVTPRDAARKILTQFLPRAFRRPVVDADIAPYLSLYDAAQKEGQQFEPSVLYAIRGVLVSPNFLFRIEPPNNTTAPRKLEQFALASRLSYFLWGSMPDELLFDVAATGKLDDPEVLKQLVRRMLRNDRSLGLAQRFVEQWLHTRELATDKAPDAKLFPIYAQDEELRSDIRFQPILFFQEVFMRNQSLLDFIDSKHTIGTSNLNKHYGVKMPIRQAATKQPQWVELPEGTRRGGLLGMSAVLAVSSYPYRTSPVLRGAWVLDTILGTPPLPPPPNVPPLEEQAAGAAPKSMRERLSQHRTNAVCNGCHSRIDPIGFALENYDAIGLWRDQEGGKPVDNVAELSDGTKVEGVDGLKKALLDRKDLFVRNLTRRMLGYALGRGLTVKDSCTVDAIVAQLRENNYSSQTLIDGIVQSVPFRTQAPSPVRTAAVQEKKK
ncbi:MAG: DUF1592 domain-containing protein [Bryobacteraceae bacterium]